jgi:hypothetical protein
MKRALLAILGSMLAVLLLVCAIGATLPREHTSTVQVTVQAPPERVYALIRTVEQGPRWRSDLTRVELLPLDRNGRPRFREHGDETLEYVIDGTLRRTLGLRPLPRGRRHDPADHRGGLGEQRALPLPRGVCLRIRRDTADLCTRSREGAQRSLSREISPSSSTSQRQGTWCSRSTTVTSKGCASPSGRGTTA